MKTRWPDIAIAPGETILETIGIIGMTQAELAYRMERPASEIDEIVHGTMGNYTTDSH